MKEYIRFPDGMVLITEDHQIQGPSEIIIKMKGLITRSVDFDDKTWWLLEPDPEAVSLEITPIKDAILKEE